MQTQSYYPSNESLYKIANRWGLNTYEFDILKRIFRSRNKGDFKKDLEKSIDVLNIYSAEYPTLKNFKGKRHVSVFEIKETLPETNDFEKLVIFSIVNCRAANFNFFGFKFFEKRIVFYRLQDIKELIEKEIETLKSL